MDQEFFIILLALQYLQDKILKGILPDFCLLSEQTKKLHSLTLLEVETCRVNIFTISVVNCLCKFIPERLLVYPNYYFIDIIS